MSRERVEDLGRLAVILDKVRQNNAIRFSSQNVSEMFDSITKDLKELNGGGFGAIDQNEDTLLWKLLCDISDVSEDIYECLDIAEGTDRLNEDHDVRGCE